MDDKLNKKNCSPNVKNPNDNYIVLKNKIKLTEYECVATVTERTGLFGFKKNTNYIYKKKS